MVETIEKVRKKIGQLLQRTHELKLQLEENRKEQAAYRKRLALAAVRALDDLDGQLSADDLSAAERERLWAVRKHWEDLLEQLGVVPLKAPLDKLADFIKIVESRPAKGQKNGRVLEVLKKGYLQNDELLRPTHVVVVENEGLDNQI